MPFGYSNQSNRKNMSSSGGKGMGGQRQGGGKAVGASNKGKAASLKKHMTGQPTVSHNSNKGVPKGSVRKSRGTSGDA